MLLQQRLPPPPRLLLPHTMMHAVHGDYDDDGGGGDLMAVAFLVYVTTYPGRLDPDLNHCPDSSLSPYRRLHLPAHKRKL